MMNVDFSFFIGLHHSINGEFLFDTDSEFFVCFNFLHFIRLFKEIAKKMAIQHNLKSKKLSKRSVNTLPLQTVDEIS